MIVVKSQTDDLFESGAPALVCPVNCLGAMGAGLAKIFAAKYTMASRDYRHAVDMRLIQPGGVIASRQNDPKIFFAATKDDWSEPSEARWVASCIEKITDLMDEYALTSIAVPALGAGLGGLAADVVEKFARDAWTNTTFTVLYYPPR